MLTQEQLEQRRQGLTATDITKVTGLSKYGGAIDVQLDKAGVAAPFVDTDRVKWGNILEDPIRQDYAERHKAHMRVPGTLIHPDEPWAMATPDGICWDPQAVLDYKDPAPDRGYEVKTHTVWLAHEYGEPGTDEVPPAELVQCAWNIWVARAYYRAPIERWDLTVFLDGLPTDFVITRDEELEATLVETGRTFWQDHIVDGKPIPADGTASYSRQLDRRFPKNTDDYLTADEAAMAVINELREVRTEIREREVEEERLVQVVKELIGDAAGIRWGKGKARKQVTWKRSKDAPRTDWKALVAELEPLVNSEFLREAVARHTAIKPGSRRFNVPRSWNK